MQKFIKNPRFSYSPLQHRPSWTWPGGHKIAFYIAINIEHFSFGSGHGAGIAPSATNSEYAPDILNWSWREYGNRCGVWRVMDLMNEFQFPSSVLLNSEIVEHCPSVIDAFIHGHAGNEIIAHGRTNSEKQSDMDIHQERQMIVSTTNILNEYCNHNKTDKNKSANIEGWLGPWISETENTVDLLAENGYKYVLDWCMDDQPVWMQSNNSTNDAQQLLSIPYQQELNDIPYFMSSKLHMSQFVDDIQYYVEELMNECVKHHRGGYVVGLALHPYIIGQPHRLRLLRKAFQFIEEQIRQNENLIWVTTPKHISDFVYTHQPPIP